MSHTREYNIRNLVLPQPKTELHKKSFGYHGASVWNGLHSEVKKAQSVVQFKTDFKNRYFN